MLSNHPDFNLNIIFPIIKISTFLHILPFCDRNGTPKCLKYNRIVSVLFTAITLTLLIYFSQNKENFARKSSKILSFLTRVKGLLSIASNLHGFATANLLNTEKYCKLLVLTKKCFGRLNKAKSGNSKGFLLIVFYNVFVVCGKGFGLAVWYVHKKQVLPPVYFIFSNVVSYFFYINILFLWGFIYFVLGCLRGFKFELKLWMDGGALRVSAKEICGIFLMICETVELFGDVFGLQLFITILFIIVDLLVCLDLFITSGVVQFGTETSLTLLFWTSVLIIMGIILANYSEKVKSEINSICAICYECVYRFRGEIGREFSSLAEQIANRNPKISAGGFFNVDHSMLFTLSNLIVSYLIVVIQLGD